MTDEARAGEPLDSQTRDLIEACAERNIYSRFDMEYAFQPWALDVERLAEAIAASGFEGHPVDIVKWAGEIAAEYIRLSESAPPVAPLGETDR